MSAASAFEEIPGVRACLVGDNSGRVFEETGANEDGAGLLVAAATLAAELEHIGSVVGLGPLDAITTKASTASWVIGSHGDLSIAVQVEPGRPTEAVEAALRATPWFAMVEWEVSTAEIEGLMTRDLEAPRERTEADDFQSGEAPTSPLPGELIPVDFASLPPASLAEAPIFAGDLKMFSLADLIEFLTNARRTGALTCRSNGRRGKIHMRSGSVIAASCAHLNSLEDYLAAELVASDEEAKTIPRNANGLGSSHHFAVALVNDGVITAAQARSALDKQLRDTVTELLTWTDGEFSFDPERLSSPTELELELEFDSRSLLLEIFRLQDEAGAKTARGGFDANP